MPGQPPGVAPNAGAPAGAPMQTPNPQLGQQEKAKASIEMALKVLYMSGIAFEPMSDQSKAIRKAIDTLTKEFGSTAHEGKELVPTEIAQLMQGMQGPAGAQPKAGAA